MLLLRTLKRLLTTRVSITTVMSATIGTLVVLAAGAVFAVAMLNMARQTESILNARIDSLAVEVQSITEGFMGSVESHAEWVAAEMGSAGIDLNDPRQVFRTVSGALLPLSQARFAVLHLPNQPAIIIDLEKRLWRRENRDIAESVAVLTSVSAAQWRPRPTPGTLDVRGAYATPIMNGVTKVGVLEVFIDIDGLSTSFGAADDYNGFEITRFMVIGNQDIIAHPVLLADGFVTGQVPPRIPNSGDPVLDKFLTGDYFLPAWVEPGGENEIGIVRIQDASGEDQDYVAVMRRPFGDKVSESVAVGSYLKAEAGSVDFEAMFQLLAAGLVIIIIAEIAAIILGRKLAAPIIGFSRAAKSVRDDDLTLFNPLNRSRVLEYDEAAKTLNHMVEGLRDRAKIRDLFGRYVPEGVAKMLMRDDESDRPKLTTATVLYLDIAGFTTMAEKLEPHEIVATLNAFFSEAVSQIEAEGGMVTQFQGDAILAVFNLPVEQADHASAAIRAAERICTAAHTKFFAGQTLSLRIGVNTGPLVAGAVGASNRLSYTVHGDAVNLAARLEQMNKQTGTEILISRETTLLAPDISTREIGSMEVRGRDEPVLVFTIDHNAHTDESKSEQGSRLTLT